MKAIFETLGESENAYAKNERKRGEICRVEGTECVVCIYNHYDPELIQTFLCRKSLSSEMPKPSVGQGCHMA